MEECEVCHAKFIRVHDLNKHLRTLHSNLGKVQIDALIAAASAKSEEREAAELKAKSEKRKAEGARYSIQ